MPTESQQRRDPTYNDFRHAVKLAETDPAKASKILESLFENNAVAMRSYVLGWFQGLLTDPVAKVLLPPLCERRLLAPLLLDPNALPEARAAKLAVRACDHVESFAFTLVQAFVRDPANALRGVNILLELPLEKRMLAPLIDLFVDAESDVQAVIATIVGDLDPDHETVQVILSGGDSQVRLNLVNKLIEVEHAELPRHLNLLTSDKNAAVRSRAAYGLAQLGDEKGPETLKQMLTSSDDTFKTLATQAAGDLADPQFEPQLRKLLREPEMALRRAAQNALTQIAAAKTRRRQEKRTTERSTGAAKRAARTSKARSTGGSVSNSWRLIGKG